MPPVRLASRDELTAAARVAPLLRAAQDLAAWAGKDRVVTGSGDLTDTGAAEAAGTLDLSLDEIHAAWAIAVGTAMITVDGDQAGPGDRFGVLGAGRPDEGSITSTAKWSSCTCSPARAGHSAATPGPHISDRP